MKAVYLQRLFLDEEIGLLEEMEGKQLVDVFRETEGTKYGDVSLVFEDRESFTSEEVSAALAAAKACIDAKLDGGPFEPFINMVARRVFANTYKRE